MTEGIYPKSLGSIMAAHPLLAMQSRVAFADLLEYTWILQPAHSPMRDVIEREFQVHHAVMPPGSIETGSILTTSDRPLSVPARQFLELLHRKQ